jgi:phenylalanyl-tRNA synthetase alpha chain
MSDTPNVMKLPEAICRVVGVLLHDGPASIADLAGRLGLDQSIVAAACTTAAGAGLVDVAEDVEQVVRLGPKARELAGGELPERLVLEALAMHGEPVPIRALAETLGVDAKVIGESLRWLQDKGWAVRDEGLLRLTEAGRAAVGVRGDDEHVIAELRAADDWIAMDPSRLAPFAQRKRFIDTRDRVRRVASATARARGVELVPIRQVTALTPEMLLDGSWRDVEFTPYDVTAAAKRVFPGKEHPLRRTIWRVRRVFLEMGFTEITSPLCESSFWDFDALFQPQDHPAREMQDTFYVERPGPARLPTDEVVARVKSVHEDGGDTGSVGWRYEWSLERARQPVLRTHCTAATIRALAEDPRPPRKVFCVGPVFRRETISYKHLPVFHQVDGIIIDQSGSFASLLGTLAAFYRKMGFERFQFRPAFFPYTEPSVEIYVWHEAKGTWVEMGGSGVFRPEVTEPLGCRVPVLAWGLGIERLALFRYGLEKIGDLYGGDLAWLEEAPLCR